MLALRKNSLVLLLTILTLVSFGCAKKQVNNASSSNPTASITNSDDESANNPIEIGGTSDENKAGALRTVYFDLDSFDISGDTKDALENNAKFLKANDSVKILIEGHCDERGGVQYNLALGEKRARAVRDFISALGVKKSRIEIVSHGKEKPQDDGHNESAWAKNRRATFVVQSK